MLFVINAKGGARHREIRLPRSPSAPTGRERGASGRGMDTALVIVEYGIAPTDAR
jgi:hypothetical protein